MVCINSIYNVAVHALRTSAARTLPLYHQNQQETAGNWPETEFLSGNSGKSFRHIWYWGLVRSPLSEFSRHLCSPCRAILT